MLKSYKFSNKKIASKIVHFRKLLNNRVTIHSSPESREKVRQHFIRKFRHILSQCIRSFVVLVNKSKKKDTLVEKCAMKTSVKTNYVNTKSREKLKSTHKHSKQVLQISQNHLKKTISLLKT